VDDEAWEAGGHLRIGLPLFDRGQGEAAAQEARVAGLRQRSVQTATEIRAVARTARVRAESARLRALHFREVLLPTRQRVLEESLRQYDAMQIGVFQLLQAQRDTLEAGAGYVAALLDYWRARAALNLVLAGRHSGLDLGGIAATPAAAPAESP
jgi:outer membrane protein TolC